MPATDRGLRKEERVTNAFGGRTTRGAARTSLAAALLLLLTPAALWAPEVRLSVQKGFGEKVVIALPLFTGEGRGGIDPAGVRDVLGFDLANSGYFSLVENTEFVDDVESDDRATGDIDFPEWVAIGAEVLVKGSIDVGLTEFRVEASVYDLARGQPIFGRRYTGEPDRWRRAVHRLSDDIVRQLTGEPGVASTQIAYVSNETGTKVIYVMDYDGANQRRVTRDGTLSIYPDWFPGGEAVICTRFRGKRQETYRADVSSGALDVVTSFPGLNAFPAVSPDGDEIALSLSRDGNTEIYRVRADGTSPRRLTFGRSTESSPRWSPDGRRIVFVSDRAGTPQLYTMSANGGSPDRLTYRGSYNTSPDWSPKGDLVAYTSRVEGVFQICTVDVETKEVVRITAGPGHKEDPSWGPDGRHVVYSMTSGGSADLYMIDIYDLEPVKLTSGTSDYSSPAWSGRLE
ncbi:MAG: Tol-Pal system beta propeller repeat protein TolB [Candidatus Eisenbacteria bacterium]|nr:Tol-Pal system beta propeller repeat protein TolB [Candidatus Eisenbacteria bacterium]